MSNQDNDESKQENEGFRVVPTAEEQAAFALFGMKQRGETLSESFLLYLCERSFLSLWSYAGVHRIDNDGTPKEVCDVLVVFGNHVLIFSDKHCNFGEALDTRVAWRRWYVRAIERSIDQLHGAEKVIRSGERKFFLDKACTIPFPYDLPSASEIEFHLIAVARGASQACIEFMSSGSGSLIIDTQITGDSHYGQPFRIGRHYPNKSFVHVFDEVGLEAVFSTFTTTADFVRYLQDRQKLLTNCRIVSAGEEETVAVYFGDAEKAWEGSFQRLLEVDTGTVIQITENLWDEFQKALPNKTKLNETSVLWDGIIQSIAQSIHNGKVEVAYPADIKSQESVLRIMAKESRDRRIFLSAQINGLHRGTPDNQRAIRSLISTEKASEPFNYVFICYPNRHESFEEYREERRVYLLMYCQALKLKFPHLKQVTGITFENASAGTFSVEVVFVNLDQISDEELALISKMKDELEILTDLKSFEFSGKDIEGLLKDDYSGFAPKNLKPY